ncbi:AcrR family transcriptional regulator [Silvibacterium bohemicum]|uniref:AcrR family transcriptional regulator n=1 Tax=Silvibacterium bohemicum TaxID=1577686 RepID=A0A841JWR7_9BACT|nr:TetR/AcrR family transcriptional regulator [Silvibacterium bohemicum]MBB6144159.1 AcrR family transcriptional regulator [Silvibacterium bohemicum]
MARPRVFDIDKAIEIATDLFWRNGYEQTSLANLTQAMGITPPSFYFAFQSKDNLFWRVIEHYQATYLGFMEEALRQPTARGVAEGVLYGSANTYSDALHPRGCLIVNCSLPCSDDAIEIRRELAKRGRVRQAKLRKRFRDAKSAGDLPPDSDPDELTRFILVVRWGMAMDSQAGASRKDLHRTVARAMQAWPR